MNTTRKAMHTSFLAAACVAAALAASAATAAPGTGSAWLWLTSTEQDCVWTVDVTWAGFSKAKTLEVFVTETYFGVPLVPKYVPVNGKGGTATVTLDPLAPAATGENFYAWAQLRDSHGAVIPASLDFASIQYAYCAAP